VKDKIVVVLERSRSVGKHGESFHVEFLRKELGLILSGIMHAACEYIRNVAVLGGDYCMVYLARIVKGV